MRVLLMVAMVAGCSAETVSNNEFCEPVSIRWCELRSECAGREPRCDWAQWRTTELGWCCEEVRPKDGPAGESGCSLNDRTETPTDTLNECLEAMEHLGCPQIEQWEAPAACYE